MAKQYSITITNGEGSENILNDTYTVTANVLGYDNTTIDPNTLTIVEGTNEYTLQIEAKGSLTLHVSETGESTGTPITGATFYRTDSAGTEYGNLITTDSEGKATFNNVPFDSEGNIIIYYKQTASDGSHDFDSGIKSFTLTKESDTFEIKNGLPSLKTIKLIDKNYNTLGISSGTINLN